VYSKNEYMHPHCLPYINHTDTDDNDRHVVEFRARVLNPDVAPIFKDAIMVPPMFHMFIHIVAYVFRCVAWTLKLKHEGELIDALNSVSFERRFHGQLWSSGVGRETLSWAESSFEALKMPPFSCPEKLVDEVKFLLLLMHELQMICKKIEPTYKTELSFSVCSLLSLDSVEKGIASCKGSNAIACRGNGKVSCAKDYPT